MDYNKLVLKKILDDPSIRNRAYTLLTRRHFTSKSCGVLFEISKKFPDDSIISLDILLDKIHNSDIHVKQKKLLVRMIGELVATEHVSNSDFEYGLQALASQTQLDELYSGVTKVADALDKRDVEEAIAILRNLPDRAHKLNIDKERIISARTMQQLRPAEDTERFLTGFERIDEITGGGKRGDLWFWLAYTSEFKTTSILTIAYENFLKGNNVFYVSLEMDEDEIRRSLLCLHGQTMGRVLEYRRLAEGLLSSDEDMDRIAVSRDFDNNSAYGRLDIWQPPMGCTILDVQREHELISSSSEKPFDIVVLDYIQELLPISRINNFREERNETIRYAKRYAMEANNRRGIWLISGYQTNTEGRKQAEKQGYYDKWAVSDTIAAARSANVICWSLQTDKMLREKEVKIGIAKSRSSTVRGSHHYVVADPSVGLYGRTPVRVNLEENLEGMSVEEMEEILG